MIFRLRLTAWYAVSVMVIVAVLMFTAHRHLDEELRSDRWDRSHPQFPQWIIHGSYTDEEVQDILGELMHVWMWVGIPLVLGSVAAGYLIALRSVRPIRCLNRELGDSMCFLSTEGCASPRRIPNWRCWSVTSTPCWSE